MNHFVAPPQWEWYIVWYFFLGGIAGGVYALGAILCGLALRHHRRSAVIGLVVCILSVGAAAIDILKVFHKI